MIFFYNLGLVRQSVTLRKHVQVASPFVATCVGSGGVFCQPGEEYMGVRGLQARHTSTQVG